jgi:hypothetical protein
MDRQQFTELVKDPGLLGSETITGLEDLLRQYPYCQTAQVLLTRNLLISDHPSYPGQLRKATAYAGDRKILKDFLERRIKPVSVPAAEIPVPAPEQPTLHSQEPFIEESLITEEEIALASPQPVTNVPEISFFRSTPSLRRSPEASKEKISQEDLLSIVRKRLAEINEEKNKVSSHPEQNKQQAEDQPGMNPPPSKDLSKEELIEKFIHEEPQISRPKTAFFNPTSSAHRSNMDEEEIVSETLALLYARQGNIQKAIHIYQKLSLRFSEKSRYFAAQIENIKGIKP